MHATNNNNNNRLLCIFPLLLEKVIRCLLNLRSPDSFKILHTFPWINKAVQIDFHHILFQAWGCTRLSPEVPSKVNYHMILLYCCNWLMMLGLHILFEKVTHGLAVVASKFSNYWSK